MFGGTDEESQYIDSIEMIEPKSMISEWDTIYSNLFSARAVINCVSVVGPNTIVICGGISEQ